MPEQTWRMSFTQKTRPSTTITGPSSLVSRPSRWFGFLWWSSTQITERWVYSNHNHHPPILYPFNTNMIVLKSRFTSAAIFNVDYLVLASDHGHSLVICWKQNDDNHDACVWKIVNLNKIIVKLVIGNGPMDSVQVGKAVFVKENQTTLGIEPRTYSYPGRSGDPHSVCWVKKNVWPFATKSK